MMVRQPKAGRNSPDRHGAESGPATTEKGRLVLAKARAVFLAHGFSAATTDMIQRAAGVSKSTMYSYYPNKEALFAAVVEAECESSLKRIRSLTITGKRIADVLRAMARGYLEMVLSPEVLALYRIVASEAPRFPELGRRFYLAGPGAMISIVADALKVATAKGEFNPGGIGCDTGAALFVSMVRGEPQMQCLMQPNSASVPAQRERWAKDAVTVFLRTFQ